MGNSVIIIRVDKGRVRLGMEINGADMTELALLSSTARKVANDLQNKYEVAMGENNKKID